MDLPLPDGRRLSLDRPQIMGILNVTPDSFSDGGAFVDSDVAVAHGLRMIDEGADFIDVGGESTRPGADRVAAGEQIRRTVDVIARLAAAISQRQSDALISIDTTRADVAAAALDAGATILNDVSAGREDDAMFKLAAARSAPIVLMHMQGTPATMQQAPAYGDVVAEVEAFLLARVEAAVAAGVGRGAIVIDPGIGFGKTLEHNLDLLARLDRLVATGLGVLLGASRKRFVRTICGADDSAADATVGGTCATTTLGVAAGVQLFRVHDVEANRDAADVAFAIAQHSK